MDALKEGGDSSSSASGIVLVAGLDTRESPAMDVKEQTSPFAESGRDRYCEAAGNQPLLLIDALPSRYDARKWAVGPAGASLQSVPYF